MKSFEKILSENCPAIFDLQRKVEKEQGGHIDPLVLFDDSTPITQPITEEVLIEPQITEWETIKGKRSVDESFLRNMSIGY